MIGGILFSGFRKSRGIVSSCTGVSVVRTQSLIRQNEKLAFLESAHEQQAIEMKAVSLHLQRAEYERQQANQERKLAVEEKLRVEEEKLQTETDLNAMRARCAHAEAGHAALTEAFNNLAASQANIKSLMNENFDSLNHRMDLIDRSIRDTVRNFTYAPDLAPLTSNLTADGIRRLGQLLQPKTVVGATKVRIGGASDGGYVMLNDFDRVKVAFSLGIGTNVNWDLGLADRGIKIHQFDHTIEAPPHEHPNFLFYKRKISNVSGKEQENLASMIRFLDCGEDIAHAILKVDIEHDEWVFFADADPECLKNFSQIVCEFHWFGRAVSEDWLKRAELALTKLNRDFQVIHVHANNCAPYSLIGGVPMPSVLEVTYCNRSLHEFSECSELLPGELDFPNNPQAPDYFLGSFRF